MDIENYLKTRHLNKSLYNNLTVSTDDFTVMLYNLSGQIVGYQTVTPALPKSKSNLGKYYTYISEHNKTAVFGLESINPDTKQVFITEGIFDAARLHLHGIAALAILGNNRKDLLSFLFTLPYELIVAAQGDRAGASLCKFGHKVVQCPDNEDVGSLTEEQFNELFGKFTTHATNK